MGSQGAHTSIGGEEVIYYHNTEGRVLRAVRAPESEAEHNCAEGEGWVVSNEDVYDLNAYVVADGELQLKEV